MAKKKDNEVTVNTVNGVLMTETKMFKVSNLNFAPYNPRFISDEEMEKLKLSLTTYGYVQKILVNERTMNIVGGNQRLRALIELGFDEISCEVINVDDNNEMALNIALNKIEGEWSEDKLGEIFKILEESDFDLGLTGFSALEIDEITNLMPDSDETDFNGGQEGSSNNKEDKEDSGSKDESSDNLSDYYGIINFESKEQFLSFQEKFSLSSTDRTVHYSAIESLFGKEESELYS